ncbi:hypothetical protein M407DRAFT_128225 [Tulasnella calospora MUT 4182]|uniref:Secreted protein n=1 Tax=Tulasnella calospora MUT 4182 TaxID=1051891 RepID=A0A0C3ML41_9AGAM|nr:hypothetical protein M407DRAFT_128225 [Tulasnella calospora MUT 4182]
MVWASKVHNGPDSLLLLLLSVHPSATGTRGLDLSWGLPSPSERVLCPRLARRVSKGRGRVGQQRLGSLLFLPFQPSLSCFDLSLPGVRLDPPQRRLRRTTPSRLRLEGFSSAETGNNGPWQLEGS